MRVVAKTDGNHFELWVEQGRTHSGDRHAKPFEPSFRGEVRNSRNGLGLGLHFASQIAQAKRTEEGSM